MDGALDPVFQSVRRLFEVSMLDVRSARWCQDGTLWTHRSRAGIWCPQAEALRVREAESCEQSELRGSGLDFKVTFPLARNEQLLLVLIFWLLVDERNIWWRRRGPGRILPNLAQGGVQANQWHFSSHPRAMEHGCGIAKRP